MGNLGGEMLQMTSKGPFEKLSLQELFNECRQQSLSCALYRLPNTTTRHLIIDLSPGSNLQQVNIEELGSGFIFHPFSTEHLPIKFIQSNIHIAEDLPLGKRKVEFRGVSEEDCLRIFKSTSTSNESTKTVVERNGRSISPEKVKLMFEALVEKSLQAIDHGDLQKVVIARAKNIPLPEGFNPLAFFDALTDQYPNAFVYLSFIQDTGMWIGATPETLINVGSHGQFATTALAATQQYDPTIPLCDNTWSQKDIEEQALVSRYIVNCFKKIRLREYEEIGPRTHLSGNLIHLKTDYKVDMAQVGFPQLGSVMLQLLHPTSAVCGEPKEAAKDFILQNEGFDREYYSGYIGPVNMLGETTLFVNLRCMRLFGRQGTLYSGAGIIANSIPEKEWIETEIKMETLLKVLFLDN